jgi:hypothetical protein
VRRLAVVLDDWALAALPGLDLDLARAGALVVRCYERLPSPAVLRRLPECHGVAVLGGPDLASLHDRLETATATLAAPVIAALPPGQAPVAELRGPGVVDLVPAGAPRAAERVALMARVPIVTGGSAAMTGAASVAVAVSSRSCSEARSGPPRTATP